MIELRRLNGHAFVVNADLIQHIEAIPDTTLTLVTGDKIVVRESCDEVVAGALAWRSSLLCAAWPSADAALLPHAARVAVQAHSEVNR